MAALSALCDSLAPDVLALQRSWRILLVFGSTVQRPQLTFDLELFVGIMDLLQPAEGTSKMTYSH